MSHEERIKELEGQLEAEEAKIKALFLTVKIPTPGDYAERDRIRAELKTARRVPAMDERRIEPKLWREEISEPLAIMAGVFCVPKISKVAK